MSPSKDFFIDSGVPAFNSRGCEVLDGLEELLKIAISGLECGALKDVESEPQSVLATDITAVRAICAHLCLSYLYSPSRIHYGVDQGSLLVDILFWRIFDTLPKDELYQRYIGLRAFLNQSSQRKSRDLEFSRPLQFAIDVTGNVPGFDLVLVIQQLMLQLMLDTKLVLESEYPRDLGKQLAQTMLERTTQRLDKARGEILPSE
jgi:hypothetical protein